MDAEHDGQKEERLLKVTGLIFIGIGAALLGLTGALALVTGELPDRLRGSVAGAILLVAGIVQLVRWRIAVRRSKTTRTQ